mmetsp:Transcript_176824/g.567176  ORF Transcript_176824/g.567176 Transcript_176824/m.567176 type:complete len:201 (-) Transcript_176824:361-963(-)
MASSPSDLGMRNGKSKMSCRRLVAALLVCVYTSTWPCWRLALRRSPGTFADGRLVFLTPSLAGLRTGARTGRAVGLTRRAALGEEQDCALTHVNNRAEFDAHVGKTTVTVAMFSSPMCGPCLLVESKIAQMQADLCNSGVNIIKLNLIPGKNIKELRPLFTDLKIKTLPTFIVYDNDGAVKGRFSGTKHEELRKMISGLL